MNMPIEQQVASLELSRKLKELGVPQEGLFWWNEMLGGETTVAAGDVVGPSRRDQFCSAFTVAELGEILPKGSYTILTEYRGKWSWQCKGPKGSFVNGFQTPMNEADARATLLIYLIEKEIIDPVNH